MKAKAGLMIFSVVVIGLLVYFASSDFYSGIKPAIFPPVENISEFEDQTNLGLKIANDFSISIFAEGLVAPRMLTYDPAGHLIASITSEGGVVVLPDRDGDGKSDETIVLLKNLNRPHGLAVRCTEQCQLYVAETDKVVLYDYQYDETRKIHQPVNGRKIIDLPSGSGHFTRTLLFLPSPDDHKLLISTGSSCNVCQEEDSRRAKIFSANADGSDFQKYATGLRNAVFMAIHPVTGEIWATEMGRDNLGDNLPPDEINIIKENSWYGWPWFYGKNIEDHSWSDGIPSYAFEPVPSHIDIPAHSAPLGLAFIPEEGWSEDYWYNLLVAYHGSWNSSVPTGYKVVRLKLDAQGNYAGTEDFLSGWLQPNGAALGRPVDILIQPGGVIYISDDKAGVIYRVTYQP